MSLDALEQVLALQPVSFIYNDGDGRTRYGFIAEDTANVDAHLATYNASGTVSGIDDRSILAILVNAIKDLWSKVLALIESDEAQNARIKQLGEEVAALKAAAGAGAGGGGPAPDSLPASGDTGTTTTTLSTDSSAAGTASEGQHTVPDDGSASEDTPDADTPATSENGEGAALIKVNQPSEATDEAGASEASEPTQELTPANDNAPVEQLPATGTE